MVPPEIDQLAIIGAGQMGHSIGQEFARAGFEVTFFDSEAGARNSLLDRIRSNLQELLAFGLVRPDEVEATLARIRVQKTFEAGVSGADLVIEVVPEDLSLKRDIFIQLGSLCGPQTILASNTSGYLPSALAEGVLHPERVLVFHFFYPAHLIPLVEIVKGPSTSDEAVYRVRRLAEKAGKKPIVAEKECPGFIANRLQLALLREALYLLNEGFASAEEIDAAVKHGFGRRLAVAGPLEMIEVQDGWTVAAEILRVILPDLDVSTEAPPIVQALLQQGDLGPRSGKGLYAWDDESLKRWQNKLTAHLAAMQSSGASL